MGNEPNEMGTAYKLMTEDEVMQVKVLVSSLRAENAKLRDDLATLHKVAGMVAKSGGDSLTQMAHDLSAAIERLRAENARLLEDNAELLAACDELTDCMDIWQGEGSLPAEWEAPLRMAVEAIERAKGCAR